jgi:PKD repeat protein
MGWMWDINGDGFKDFSDRTCEHTYTSAGDYTVTLSVTRYSELFTVTRTNYIHVQPAPQTTSPTPTPTVTLTTVPTTSPPPGSMTVNLHSGWNFVSTPKTLADGHRTVSEVFAGINTDGHSIFSYNAQSQSWIQVNSNNDIPPLQGLWVYSAAPGQVILVFRNDETVPPARLLSQGWNAVGFSRTDPASAREILLPVQNYWTQLFGFNAATQGYETSIINGGTGSHSDTNLLYPGKGYWIFMNGQGIMT